MVFRSAIPATRDVGRAAVHLASDDAQLRTGKIRRRRRLM
jgi:hypothetical protein